MSVSMGVQLSIEWSTAGSVFLPMYLQGAANPQDIPRLCGGDRRAICKCCVAGDLAYVREMLSPFGMRRRPGSARPRTPRLAETHAKQRHPI